MKHGWCISDNAQKVNFREINAGKIAPKLLYRSSHPIQQNRQELIITPLASSARIASVINLADTNYSLIRKAFFAPWYNRLLKSGRVIALGMDFNFTSAAFQKKLKKALQFIIKTDGPYLIHCYAGVDRTGIVSIVLEAFMGATLDEVAADYLFSFNSIFDSSVNLSHTADTQVVKSLLSIMDGEAAITDEVLQGIAEKYLKNTVRLSDGEIDLLRLKLSGELTTMRNSLPHNTKNLCGDETRKHEIC